MLLKGAGGSSPTAGSEMPQARVQLLQTPQNMASVDFKVGPVAADGCVVFVQPSHGRGVVVQAAQLLPLKPLSPWWLQGQQSHSLQMWGGSLG